MKPFLTLAFLSAIGTLGAQSFEWDAPTKAAPAVQAKEVVVPAATDATVAQAGKAGVYAAEAQGSRTAYGEVYEANQLTGSHGALPLGTLLRVTNESNGRTVVIRVTDKGQECADCVVTLSEAAARELGIVAQAPVSFERAGFSNWNPLPPASAGSQDEKGIVAPQPLLSAPRTVADNDKVPEPQITFSRRPTTVVTPPAPTVPAELAARGTGSVAKSPVPAPVMPAEVSGYAVQLAAYTNELYAKRRVSELQGQGLTDVFYRSTVKDDGQVINRVYFGAYTNVNDAQAAAREIQGKFNIAGIVAKM